MKVKYLFLFLIVSFFLTSCWTKPNKDYLADDYYLSVSEADSLYIIKEYEKSYEILDELFSNVAPLNTTPYKEISTYVKLKVILDDNLEYTEYTELITKYGFPIKYLKKDSVLSIYYAKVRDRFDTEASTLRKEYETSLNLELRDKIIEMKRLDQLYRQGNYKQNIEKQNKIDSTNAEELIYIFDTYGFPSETIIGGYYIDNQFVNIDALLLHTKDSIRENFLSLKFWTM
ncbi:hypothetical protein H2O64_20860 [Kordia sp. YSTF-M3]|uniref:DUF4296 domain-containing protein n=1 Tax=Kordia aestuariivivens TaxID=2759037 RepID=A0ABR7QFD7_9FLAO|nr:hypothetical protein [Kordia aestuariivivens]MBC8757133.1 hypothetical protein [Kordia aestuariivivens]